uniref:Uncharacterized protein n=1 Tax=Onchocerca volvulus TaxID=6282 RepID=A0A8R1TTL0_ONCVO
MKKNRNVFKQKMIFERICKNMAHSNKSVNQLFNQQSVIEQNDGQLAFLIMSSTLHRVHFKNVG